MNRLAIWKILVLAAALGLAAATAADARLPAGDVLEAEGPNVRVMRHTDGSNTRFTRSPDHRTLTKRKFSANGVLTMRTVYRMDSEGNPTGCHIFDGQGQRLFKVSYGYRRSDGQLVEERMFDARARRANPDGQEIPVQRICYVFDQQGNRSAPIVFNLLPGKTFEEVFGVKSSALETNPFNLDVPGGR